MAFNFNNLGMAGQLTLGTDLTHYPREPQSTLLPDGFAVDYGFAVSVDGLTMAVGDPLDTEAGTNAGAVYVYQQVGATWEFMQKIYPTISADDSLFGYSVAISGNILAVGCPGRNSTGTVQLFILGGGYWAEYAEISPNDLTAGAEFGKSISFENNTLVAGAPFQSTTGAVYIIDFDSDLNTWVETAQFSPGETGFGSAVSLHNGRMMVGSPLENSSAGKIFVYHLVNELWQEVQTFAPATLAPGDNFGMSVSMSGETMCAGAVNAVHMYAHTFNAWIESTVLTGSDNFGHAVSLQDTVVAIGQPGTALTSGKYLLYKLVDGTWSNILEIDSPDSTPGNLFGTSICLHHSILGIGAPDETGPGRAYAFFPVVPPVVEPEPMVYVPVILSVNPPTGYYTGYEQITIVGQYLGDASLVTIGGTPVISMFQVNISTIIVVTPPGTVGPAMVSVTTPLGVAENQFVFEYVVPVPTIETVVPNNGTIDGGTSVTITGTYLTGATAVYFDDALATDLVVVSANVITVTTPANDPGYSHITVVTPHGTVARRNSFNYYIPAPNIDSVVPDSGTVDGETFITITGNNLTTVQTIQVGAYLATGIFVNDDEHVTALTPEAFAGGPVPVVLTTDYGVSNADHMFTYIVPAPVINSITPDSGTIDGGTPVTISGNYFIDVTAISLQGIPLVGATVVDKRTITGTTPAGIEGTASVGVTTTHGVSTPNTLFTYFVPPPEIFSLSPNWGSVNGNTFITITGNNLTTVSTVTFAGAVATDVIVIDDEHITVVTPTGATGPASVIATTDYGSNPANTLYTYMVLTPVVTLVTPDTGYTTGNTSVVITGLYFTGTTSVTFDGIDAVSFTVVDDSTINAETPVHLPGAVSVLVTTADGTSAANTAYTYVIPPPVVTLVTPAAGSILGGNTVTITGQYFTDALDVTFDLVSAPVYSVDSDTTITATVPAGAVGPASVVITTPGGSNASNLLYTYENFWPSTETASFVPVGAGTSGGPSSIAVDGDIMVVGMELSNSVIVQGGEAIVYRYNGTTWVQEAKLAPATLTASEQFGKSVAVNGNTIVVGAWGHNSLAGRAYVYEYIGSTWTLQGTLYADSPAAQDYFGFAVAVHGDTAFIGAYGDDVAADTVQGTVYVFTRAAGVWTKTSVIFSPDGSYGRNFGISLAVDATTLVVGSAKATVSGVGGLTVGGAYIYTGSGSTWTYQQKVVASDGLSTDNLGWWSSLSGDTVVLGTYTTTTNGAAYVFTRSGSVWSQQAKITAPDGATTDYFGHVAIDGDVLVVGAKTDSYSSFTNAGSAYVYTRESGIWNFQNKLIPSDAASNYQFATGVAIQGNTAYVSRQAPGLGKIYVFEP